MKAIIPAAGWGTRYSPYTHIDDKETMPLGPYPALYYGIRELAESGVKHIKIITTSDKISVIRLSDLSRYKSRTREEEIRLKEVRAVLEKVVINYQIQKEPRGPANAVLEARDFVSGEKVFCVLLPDDVCLYRRVPVIRQVCRAAEVCRVDDMKIGAAVGLQKLKTPSGWHSIVKKFSFFDINNTRIVQVREIMKEREPGHNRVYRKIDDNLFELGEISRDKSGITTYLPGAMETVGRYVFTNDFFEYTVKRLKQHKEECMITQVLSDMIVRGVPVFGLLIDGDRFDMGLPREHVRAELAYYLDYSKDPGINKVL